MCCRCCTSRFSGRRVAVNALMGVLTACSMLAQEASAFVNFTPPRQTPGAAGLPDDDQPDVVEDGSGGWGMVFRRVNDVYFSRTSDGWTWTPAVPIITTVDSTGPPVVAHVSDGTWIAAWTRKDADRVESLEFARSSDGGVTWTGGVLVGPVGPSPYPDDPVFDRDGDFSIAVDGAGQIIIAYASRFDSVDGSGNDVDVKFVRSTDAGLSWSAPALLNLDGATDHPGEYNYYTDADVEPSLAVAANGDWLAVWIHSKRIGVTFYELQLRVSRSSDGGATWSPPSDLTSETGGVISSSPRLRAGNNGTVIVALHELSTGFYVRDITYLRSTDFGLTWSPEASFGTFQGIDQGLALDTDGAGRWIVAWSSRQTGDIPYGTDYDLFFSRSSDDGLTWTAPEAANLDATHPAADTRDDVYPALASNRNGNWLLAWFVRGAGKGMYAATSQCWECAGAPLVCGPADGSPCDDGDVCTTESSCSAGACFGTVDVQAEPACRWALLAGADAETGRLKMANAVLGNVCTGTGFFENVSIIGDLVATSAQGPKGLSVKGASANLYQNVVTGGSGIQQRSAAGSLPGVEVAAIGPGQTVSKGQGVYDTTGTHELVSRCLSDKSEIALLSAFVESLGPSANLGTLKISSEQTTTVNVSSPGAVNVLDLDRLSIGRDATLTLDGGGDPSTVVVLRVDRTVKFANRATLALSGGLTPEHTMIYVRGKRFATSRGEAAGAGAIVSPAAKVTLGGSTFWTGAVVTGGTRVSLGASTYLWHMPFDGF